MNLQSAGASLKSRLILLLVPLGLMWVIECLNAPMGGALDTFGIVPRTLRGLRGIVFGPFLHANFPHLMANTLPFIILGWFVVMRRTADFIWVSLIVMLIGGLGTWAIAPSYTVHVGASGVIFGYLGFLLSRAYFERSLVSIALSIVIGVTYGGLIWGVLPGQEGISWQGHLFGFLGGIVAARLLTRGALPRRPI